MIRQNLIDYIQETPHNFNTNIYNTLFEDYMANINQFYKSSNLTKVEDYLYTIDYDKIDYDAGATYGRSINQKMGACSAIGIGNLFAHNYDWTYDNTVDFVVHTSAATGRNKSYAMATVPSLDKDLVELGTWDDFYAILPNIVLDGFNDYLACSVNIVPTGDYGYTTGTRPGAKSLCGLQLCRYVLDNATSVENAIELLSKRNIWFPHGEGFASEVHLMLHEPNNTKVVEFIHNKMVVVDTNIMTNFYTFGVKRNEDGSVYTPMTQDINHDAMRTNNITRYGSGLERYNILNDGQDDVTSNLELLELMKSVNYTQSYVEHPDETSWYTEMTNIAGLTVASPLEKFMPVMNIAYQMYDERSRDTGLTWQTIHTAVYDLNLKQLLVVSQEGWEVHPFSL